MERVWVLLFALLLGYAFVFTPARQVWKDHWLVRDGQEGTAVITKEHWAGHGVVVYRYRVGQKVYTGQDRRSRQNSKYAHAVPGEESVVYFSSSHPWLSAINLPRNVGIEGLPVVMLAWLIEVSLFITLVNPKSSWALRLGGQRQSILAKEAGGPHDADTFATANERTISSPRPVPQFDGWKFFKDKLRLVAYAVLIVLAMAAIEIAIDAVLGRR